MQNKNGLAPKKINLLLPFYLDKGFSAIFEALSFNVLWADTQEELEKLIEFTRIDIAIEWQHGERDFIIRDLLRQYKKNAKIFLALNWNGKIPPDFDKLGYVDVINVPFNFNELKLKFFAVDPMLWTIFQCS